MHLLLAHLVQSRSGRCAQVPSRKSAVVESVADVPSWVLEVDRGSWGLGSVYVLG